MIRRIVTFSVLRNKCMKRKNPDTPGSPDTSLSLTPPSSPRTRNASMRLSEWGLLILLSIIWGSSFPIMKTALQGITPMTIVFLRVSIAALILIPAVLLTGNRLPADKKIWGSFVIMAFFNNVLPFNLIAWGLQSIDSSLGSILNASTPIFSVILVHLLTRDDQLTPNRIAGVIIGWFGVSLMIGLGSLLQIGSNPGGQIAVLGASCSYALAAVYGRKRFKGIPSTTAAAGVLTCAAAISLPTIFLFESPLALEPDILPLLAVGMLGVVCTGTAYLIYYRLLASAGPTNVLLVTFLVPVTAIILSILFLGESLAWTTILGAVLLFIGLIAIDGRLIRHRGV